ncbi:ABC transporter transmembrane domain-containing protein [Methylocystis heyeri]|uniref:ATP-binding cassette domain-containing protein n=1 Tax=Methylocystis heyeri TaxID=391905 RepID=A0A6B8KCR7_9HYPH|nr:ABC transporter transmembrane domain-containing protein [Methylocystis heyeri]QGM45402.1 ATP-binding cassette domain-containing protein [Methylocystis heyeri]
MTETAVSESRRGFGSTLAPLRPLLPYVLRHFKTIILALIALSVAAGATLTLPVAVRGMIDHGFSKDSAGGVNAGFGALILVVAVLALASGTRYYLVTVLGERVVADLRTALFRHLSILDASFFDSAKTGELISRLTADTTQLKATFGSSASVALRNLFMFFGAIVMMIVSSPKLSGVALAAIPLIVAPLILSGRAVRGRSRLAQDALAGASAYAAENLAAIRTMQACGAQDSVVARFKGAAEGVYDAAREATRLRAYLTAGAIFLVFSSVVAVLWLGAQDVLASRMTSGLLSQFVLYAVLAASSLGELSQVWSEAAAAAGAAGRIGDILALRPKIAAPAKPKLLKEPVRGRLAFENVRFSYGGNDGPAAIEGLDLVVEPGERVALVGPSGAGKSTLFQLLLRFYDVNSGSVSVDGVDVRELDPVQLRRVIALAPQDPVVFGASVAQNIAYGREDAPRREIEAAARRAQAHDFIAALPNGYDTELGERGVTLSGGQRQRLAIARAILADAPVLLLDEATSALDAQNEALVQAALEDVMAGRTSLVIAHRLATVLEADRIIVLDAGRIVEQGTHAELIEQGGLYSNLARLQFGE